MKKILRIWSKFNYCRVILFFQFSVMFTFNEVYHKKYDSQLNSVGFLEKLRKFRNQQCLKNVELGRTRSLQKGTNMKSNVFENLTAIFSLKCVINMEFVVNQIKHWSLLYQLFSDTKHLILLVQILFHFKSNQPRLRLVWQNSQFSARLRQT